MFTFPASPSEEIPFSSIMTRPEGKSDDVPVVYPSIVNISSRLNTIVPFKDFNFGWLIRLRDKVSINSATISERNIYNQWFGCDPGCPNWKPHRQNMAPLYDLYFHQEAPTMDDFSGIKLKILKAYVHASLSAFFSLGMAYRFYATPEILWHPDDQRVDKSDSAKVAVFRHQAIWPLFGTTQQFWECFQDVFKETEDYMMEWPNGAPDLSYSEILEKFESAGDQDGVKLVKMLLYIYGNQQQSCRYFVEGVSAYHLRRE